MSSIGRHVNVHVSKFFFFFCFFDDHEDMNFIPVALHLCGCKILDGVI